MKEATGELSMTVITIVAIVLIAGFVSAVLWPRVSNYINNSWSNLENPKTSYVEKVDVVEYNM